MENPVEVLSGIYYNFMHNRLGQGSEVEKRVEKLLFSFTGADADGAVVYAIPAGGKVRYEVCAMRKKGKEFEAEDSKVRELIGKGTPSGPVYSVEIWKKVNVKNMPFNFDEKLEGGRENIVVSPVKIYGERTAQALERLAIEKFESKAASWIALQEFSRYSHHMKMIDRIIGSFVTVPVVNVPKGEAFIGVFWGRIEERPNDRSKSLRAYVEKHGWAYDDSIENAVKEQYGEYCTAVGSEAHIFTMSPRFIELASKDRVPVVEDGYFKEWCLVDRNTCARKTGFKAWKAK